MVFVVLLLAAAQPDSVAALRSAQREQLAFESRRGFLAARVLGSRPDECDEKIGRFCYWYGDDRIPLPREPDEIKRARTHLLGVLDSAAVLLPGDWWIAGQRVRYLVESDRFPDAVAAARTCRAERWWCEALEGFAHHAAGDDASADTVYAAALVDMPAELRCRWSDISPLLDGALRRRSNRLDCGSRAAFSSFAWWLAQPLLSRPGNDRRVEHFARLTMVRMLDPAGSAWGWRLADDMRELTLRYGWPVAWSQEPSDELNDARDVTGHERIPAFHFFPDGDANLTPGSVSWTLSPLRPHERYAPLYAKAFVTLTPDITVFRRGESTYAIVAYDLTADSTWQRLRPLSRAVVLARDTATPPIVVSIDDSSRRGVIMARAPWPAALAGFEVTQPGTLHVGRARLALALRDPALVGVSDLLVFEPGDTLPKDLSDVLSNVRGPARVLVDGRFGLYWEVYGLAPGEQVQTAVHVTPLHAGLLRRLGSLIGLGKRSRESKLEWHDVAEGLTGAMHRSVTIDVSGLDPGRYNIVLTVSGRGRTSMSERELEIVRP